MSVLGIDFGTSNTAAMVRGGDGRVRPLLFDGSPLLPSAVYLNTDGRVLVGRDAERNARLDPGRFEPNPKRRIDDGQILLGQAELAVPRLFGYVLSRVADEARRQLGSAPTDVRLTHPARWGERRRSLLVEAARGAGLGNPRLIAEPVGAASYFTAVLGTAVPVGRCMAIYDLGGGTFDATVVRRTQSGFEVLSEEGLPDVGGLDFDHAIVEHIGRTYGTSHPQEWQRLENPADPGDRRLRRLLYEDVRGAKEMLSRTTSADIHLPALEIDAHLTREEMEQLVRPYLERTVSCLRLALTHARLEPRDLVGIFLVGGSSRIPLAAHLLHTELGVPPTTLEQPETVVVEGALCIGAPMPPGARPGARPAAVPPRPVSTPPRPVSTPPGGPVSTPPRAVSAPPRPVATPPGAPPAPPRPVSTPPRSVAAPPGAAPVPPRPVSTPPGTPPVRPPMAPPAGAPNARPGIAPVPGRAQPPPGTRPTGTATPPTVRSAPPTPPGPAPMPPARPAAAPQPQSLAKQPAPARPPNSPASPPLAPPGAVGQPPRPPAVQPARRGPYPPWPGVRFRQVPSPRPAGGEPARRWYAEPAVIGTIVVLLAIIILFVVLLFTALG